jgi:hypothetical protein
MNNNGYSNHPLDITDHVMQSSHDVSKAIIVDHAKSLLQLIEEGHIDPLSVAMQMKYLQDVMELAKEKLREYVINELSKYPKGEDITKHGATFQLKEAGVSYDYSGCGHSHYNELKQQIGILTDQCKEIEKFLRTVKESITVVDETTGEIITIYAPVKKSTTTYSIGWNK